MIARIMIDVNFVVQNDVLSLGDNCMIVITAEFPA